VPIINSSIVMSFTIYILKSDDDEAAPYLFIIHMLMV
jgi:hypothetical protein